MKKPFFFFLKNWSLDNSGSFFQIFDISKPQAGFYSHTDAAQMTDPTEAHYFYFLESLSHTRGNGPYWLFVCKRYLLHLRPWVVTKDHVIWERTEKRKQPAARNPNLHSDTCGFRWYSLIYQCIFQHVHTWCNGSWHSRSKSAGTGIPAGTLADPCALKNMESELN